MSRPPRLTREYAAYEKDGGWHVTRRSWVLRLGPFRFRVTRERKVRRG